MKKYFWLFIVVASNLHLGTEGFGQQQAPNFTLDKQLYGQQEYQASQYIDMINGFGYKANTKSDVFHAKIDPFMVFPPEEGEIGGPSADDKGVVGSIAGVFDVSDLGAATYTIPINLPKGVGNNTPQVSLNYSSMSGNGAVGLGWNIGAISAIARTGKTIYHDGVVAGPQYNSNDNLVFNGMRMMPLGNDTYTTEVEGFSRIKIKESNATGPVWFEVRTKEGRILHFGQTQDSRQKLEGTETIIVWYLSSVEDISGNYISYTYETRSGNLLLKEISYGGNSNANQEHIYKVYFNYIYNRVDPFTSYINGAAIKTDYLLEYISINYIPENKEMFKYSLEYDESNTFYSRLEKVKVIDENTKNGYNSSNFSWGNFGNNTFTEISFYDDPIVVGEVMIDQFFVDINGDGLTDVIKIEYEIYTSEDYSAKKSIYWYYRLRQPDNTFGIKRYFTQNAWPTLPSEFFRNLLFGDFNGDGLVDFLDVRYNNVKKEQTIIDRVFFSKGGGFDCYNVEAIIESNDKYPEFKVGDFDGDGKQELLIVIKDKYGDNVNILEFDKSHPYKELVFSDYMACGNTNFQKSTILVADFNGDGKSDIFRTAEYAETHYTPGRSDCQIYEVNFDSNNLDRLYNSGYPTTWHQVFPADFNGDGITDILTYNYTDEDPQWEIGIFNGENGFITYDNVPDIGHFNLYDEIDSYWNSLILNDFNGDGKTDIIKLHKNENDYTADYTIFYSNGNDFPKSSSGEIIVYGGFNDNGFMGQIVYEHIFPHTDFNGDGYLDLYIENGDWGDNIYLHDINNEYYRLKSFTDGLGNKTSPEYMPLTNALVYTRRYGAQFPIANVQPPLFVVREIKSDIGESHITTKTLYYEDLQVHKQGKGILGFGKKIVIDNLTDISVETTTKIYSFQNKYYFPYVKEVKVLKPDGRSISETSSTFNHKSNSVSPLTFFPFIESSQTYEIDITTNDQIKSTRSAFTYDNYGNVLTQKSLIGDFILAPTAPDSDFDHQSTTTFQYKEPDLVNWYIGLPEKITSKVRHLLEEKNETTIEFVYYLANEPLYPFLKEKRVFPGNNLTDPLVTYESYTIYDDFGNMLASKINAPYSQPILEERNSSVLFGSEYHHRFPTSTTNALGNSATSTYDPVYGTLITSTGPNELITYYDQNPLGTFSKTTSANGIITTTVSRWAKGHPHAPINALYYTWQQTSGSPEVLVFYHKTGIELRTVTLGFDGSVLYVDKIYNPKGLLHKVSLPYKKGSTPMYTEYLYDDYNRLETVILPDGTTTTTTYGANETSVTTTNEGISRTTTKKYNAAGWLIESTDNKGNVIKNEYYCNGNLSKTYIVGQPATTVSLEYDDRGNRTLLDDPNYGQMTSIYNAFGELEQQTNPRGEITSYSYNKLGQTISETSIEGTTTWLYSNTPRRIGTLESITKNNHLTNYIYDDYLRPKSVTETIAGEPYTTQFTYDELGRPETTTHPTGITVSEGYNEWGFHTSVKMDKNGQRLWKTEEVSPLGMITRFKTGNGLVTDQTFHPLNMRLQTVKTLKQGNAPIQDLVYNWFGLGNLESRKKGALTESFTYDDLDRLEKIKLNGVQTGNHEYDTYNGVQATALGNITKKNNDGRDIFNDAIYGGSNDLITYGPHALSSVSTSNPVLTGPEQVITYNGYDKVDAITEGIHSLHIQYGHHKQRISQQYTNGANTIDKVWAGACEYITKNGQQYKHTYLTGPMGVFAIHIIKPNGTEEINYIHTDHLGSWNTITDENGNLLQEQSFDAWGNRRNPATWRAFTGTPPEPLFDRGFTGHEHLYAFNLINMNGRVYDPIIGRMLSPDNFMQAPDYTQSFNRYSYCLNNPLVYTDPSGDMAFALIWPIACFGTMFIGDAISNIVNDVSNPFGTAWDNSTTMWNGINNAVKVNIYKDNNTQVSLGASPFILGASASVTHKVDNMTFSATGGIGIGGWYAGGGASYSDEKYNVGVGIGSGNNHWAWGVNATVDGFGAGYYQTRYGNSVSDISGTSNRQSVGGANIFLNDFSIRLENDFLMFNRQDRWRSNGVEVSYMDFSIGTYLYNNDPKNTYGPKDYSTEKMSPIWGKNRPGKNGEEFGGWNKGLTYMSPLYFGYRFGNTVYRMGYNHHSFQDFTQNGIHKFFPPGRQHFYQDYSEFNYGMYYYQGWYNPYSLWGR